MSNCRYMAKIALVIVVKIVFLVPITVTANVHGHSLPLATSGLPEDWAEYVRVVKQHHELDPMLTTHISAGKIETWLEGSPLNPRGLEEKSAEVRQSVEQARRRAGMEAAQIPAEFMEQFPEMLREQIEQMRNMMRATGMPEAEIEKQIEEMKKEFEKELGIPFDGAGDAGDRNRQFGAPDRVSESLPLLAARELGIRFDVPEWLGSLLDQTRSASAFDRSSGWRKLRERHADELTPEVFTSVLPEMMAALDDESHSVRIEAAWAIAHGGSDAGPALPRLLQLIEIAPAPSADPHESLEVRGLAEPDAHRLHVANAALRAVHAIGPSAYLPARRMYQSDELARKAWALAVISGLGPAAAEMLPEFISLVHDDSAPILLRVFAIEAVGAAMNPGGRESESLIGLLSHEERIVRLAAIRSIKRPRPADQGVEQRLMQMVCDSPNDIGLAKDVGGTLHAYGRSGARAIADGIEACPPHARSAMAEVLQNIGEHDGAIAAEVVMPTLNAIGVRPRHGVRFAAEQWKELQPVDPQETRRVVAIRRDIERINTNRPSAQFEFEKILEERVRLLTPGEKSWLAPLAQELLNDAMILKQQGGLLLVMELGPQAVSAVPRLIELLVETRDPQRAGMIAFALADIGPRARSALPALERWNARHDAPFGVDIAIQKIKGELE